jgi:MFS family permease
MKQYFLKPRFTLGLVSQIMVYGAITFLQPTLALHLERYGYTAVFIGFSFAIPTLIYAATSPLIYIMTSKMRKTGVIFCGYLFVSVGLFLIGPSKLFNLSDNPSYIIMGLSILGFGAGMIIIPILPDMIDSIEENADDSLNEEELHNNISGLFIAFQGIGESIGPMAGSTLEEIVGFRSAQDYIGVFVVVYMIFYFLLCGRFDIFKKPLSTISS